MAGALVDDETIGESTFRGTRTFGAISAAVLCALVLWWVFVRGEQVPLLWGVDLGFHELGHLLAAWMPGLLPPLAGSVTQLAVPLGLAAYFGLIRRQPLSASVVLAWAGASAQNASVYIADAPTQYLPLLGGGRHDWAYILAGNLDAAAPLAGAVRFAGLLLVIAGFGLAVWPLLEPAVRARRAARERAHLAKLPRREPRNRVPLPEAGMLDEEGLPHAGPDPSPPRRGV
jgi:hypothetical protein